MRVGDYKKGIAGLILKPKDTRSARRASRESDEFYGFVPGVALSESGNPGL
jgi:hypothetical protein